MSSNAPESKKNRLNVIKIYKKVCSYNRKSLFLQRKLLWKGVFRRVLRLHCAWNRLDTVAN